MAISNGFDNHISIKYLRGKNRKKTIESHGQAILTISQPQLKMCTQSGQILQHQIADFLLKTFMF